MINAAWRNTKDGPFCWANKETLYRVGEHFAESNKVPSARSVYLALCELASNARSEQFTAKVATIARHAGLSARTVHDVLPELELIRVVNISRRTIPGSKMDAPSVYTLTHGNDCVPVGNNCIPLCNGPEQTSVAENQKNRKNNTEKKLREDTLSSSTTKVTFFPAQVVEDIYNEFPRKEGKKRALIAIVRALNALRQRGQDNPAVWLLSRVRCYAEQCQRVGKEKQHIKMPQGWFADSRYDDDLSQTVARVGGTNGQAHFTLIKPLPSSKDLYPSVT